MLRQPCLCPQGETPGTTYAMHHISSSHCSPPRPVFLCLLSGRNKDLTTRHWSLHSLRQVNRQGTPTHHKSSFGCNLHCSTGLRGPRSISFQSSWGFAWLSSPTKILYRLPFRPWRSKTVTKARNSPACGAKCQGVPEAPAAPCRGPFVQRMASPCSCVSSGRKSGMTPSSGRELTVTANRHQQT